MNGAAGGPPRSSRGSHRRLIGRVVQRGMRHDERSGDGCEPSDDPERALRRPGGRSGSAGGQGRRRRGVRFRRGRARSARPGGLHDEDRQPLVPMRPGSRWVYRETAPDGTVQRVVVTVLGRTKLIANGVTARVVRDVVTEDGKPVEVTDDWYAQDRCGNIWYLGEATTEYENGKPVSTKGSFEAGVDGAQAGVIMPARTEGGHALSAGVLRGRGRGSGRGDELDASRSRFRSGTSGRGGS